MKSMSLLMKATLPINAAFSTADLTIVLSLTSMSSVIIFWDSVIMNLAHFIITKKFCCWTVTANFFVKSMSTDTALVVLWLVQHILSWWGRLSNHKKQQCMIYNNVSLCNSHIGLLQLRTSSLHSTSRDVKESNHQSHYCRPKGPARPGELGKCHTNEDKESFL